jgi:hypothetical protein
VTERQRRRTASGRRRHRRRIGTRVLTAVGAVAFVLGLWVAVDAFTARNALETARSSLLDAQTALGEQDLARARTRIDAAVVAVARADDRTDGLRWDAIRGLPLVADDARTVKHVIEVVSAAAGTAQGAMGVMDGVLGPDDALPDVTDGGRIDLEPIRALERGFAGLDLEPLRASRTRLATSGDEPRTATATDAREQTLDAAELALAWIERGRDATGVAASILGVDEPGRYLVMVQNSGELRGTGGLIGFLAVLEIQDGQMQIGEPEGVAPESVVDGSELVVRGRFEQEQAPVERSTAFAERYDHIAAGSLLASTNADPDMPTVAPVVLDLYEQRAGERLDGIIAIDPIALQRIQLTVGPVELPQKIQDLAPALVHPLPAEQLASMLLVGVYDALGGPTDERRRYQAAVAEASLASLLGGDWDLAAVTQAIAASVAGRNLQLYSRDQDTQDAILRLGVGGALRAQEATDDLLAISANNAAGNKMDVHVSHRTDASIDLGEPRIVDGEVVVPREVTSRVEIGNSLDVEAHDVYIVQSLRPAPLGEVIEQDPRPGLARTWLTQWLPGDAELRSVTDADGEPLAFNTGEMHGRLAVDHYLEVPVGGRAAFEVVSAARVGGAWDGRELTYALSIWRQGKGIADQLDIRVAPPEGWRVLGTSLSGGGGPGLIGPTAPGTPLAVDVEDGAARLRGSATADARLVVRLAPVG